MQACQLVYDIPKKSKIKNPSRQLEGRAFRINKSVWVMQKHNVPHALINRLAKAGAAVYLVDYATGQDEQVVAMAIASLRAEVREAIARNEKSYRIASRKLELTADQNDAYYAYRATRTAIIRRSRRLFNSLRNAAITFGIDPDEITTGWNGGSAEDSVTALQKIMLTRAEKYADAAGILRRLTNDKHDPMARGIDRDEIPACIVADRLQDLDEDTAAYRLAFPDGY